jgi:parvulin-like peptidyl-prolyl isomerase
MNQPKSFSNVLISAGKSIGILIPRCFFLLILLPALILACDKIKDFSRPYVASVNGSRIYLDDYQARLDQKKKTLPKEFLEQPDDVKRFEEEVLEGMITEEIMRLRAKELKITISDTELENKISEIKKDYGEDFATLFSQQKIHYESWKKELKEEMLLQKLIAADVNAKVKITEDEIKDYYHQHRAHYKEDPRVRVAQIVVRDMTAAKKAMERLKAGESFEKVAESMSIGPEACRGGDLGFITKGVMPDSLDQTIFNMRERQISPIVQSSYGFHIFKVLESQLAKSHSLKEVREELIADIRLQKEETAFVAWLNELKSKAVVRKEKNMK